MPPRNDDSAQQLWELANVIPALISVTQSHRDEVWFNQHWLTFTGLDRQAAVKQGRMAAIHPEDLPHVQAALSLADRQGDSLEVEYRLQSSQGGYRWVMDRSVALPGDSAFPAGRVSVAIDITSQFEYRQQLEEREATMRQLHSICESEKQFLSASIHDGLMQDIIGGEMLVQGLVGIDESLLAQRLEQISGSLRSALAHGRRLISELRPAICDQPTLTTAIELYGAEIESRSGVVIRVHGDIRIDDALTFWESNVFRIIQEALSNCERHSGSPRVDVRLRVNAGRLHAEVQDYGCGFQVAAWEDSFGIRCMRERASIYGGSVAIDASSTGTLVTISVPIPPFGGGAA